MDTLLHSNHLSARIPDLANILLGIPQGGQLCPMQGALCAAGYSSDYAVPLFVNQQSECGLSATLSNLAA